MSNDADTNLGFVLAAPNRIKILKALNRMERATPTQLAKKTKLLPTNVSRTLKQLESQNLVKCLTFGLRKGKLFVLTEEGKIVQNNVK